MRQFWESVQVIRIRLKFSSYDIFKGTARAAVWASAGTLNLLKMGPRRLRKKNDVSFAQGEGTLENNPTETNFRA